MESFLIATNVVVPMALMMAVGVVMRLLKITDRPTMKKVDQMVSKVFMPLLMFRNVYTVNFASFSGVGYFFYGIGGLAVLFLLAVFLLPRIMARRDSAAAMGQAVMRPNYILFGTAVALNLYGEGNIGPVMLLGAFAIPLFNAFSVVILEVGRNASASFGKLMKSIAKNQIVIAAVIGLALNLSGLKLPELCLGVVEDLSGLATPLSFLSLGVSLDVKRIVGNKRTLALGVLARLVLVPCVFMTGALAMGFRGVELCALMLLFATPTAVSSYPLAVTLEADGDLAGQMVVFTTLGSLLTLFLWVMFLTGMNFL